MEATPSPRELDILKVLWDLGEASVRQVHEAMCPAGELAFNTVQTLLRIMDDKGLVSHRQRGRAFLYKPRFSRRKLTAQFLQNAFDGALDQVVLSLIETRDTSPDELRDLEKLIADARRKKQASVNAAPIKKKR
ncbi:MAG: BlaI/MecI/CopY family transcriptional regulator [Pirellulales bacterium]|nr:BlaI/MecI/CopY family transcriptional regulator [Pirellulales bacterium]